MEVRDPEARAIFFKKRRPNSICMFTSSSSAASSSLPCALSDVDVYDVIFAVTTSHTLTRTAHSVVVPFTQITFPAFNVFEAHAHSKQKKKKNTA